MATLKRRRYRKNSSGTYDIVHYETDTDLILTSDNMSLTTKLNNINTAINGKAASSHNHSASNITSGTLPVARGGTGTTSLESLKSSLGVTGLTGYAWKRGNAYYTLRKASSAVRLFSETGTYMYRINSGDQCCYLGYDEHSSTFVPQGLATINTYQYLIATGSNSSNNTAYIYGAYSSALADHIYIFKYNNKYYTDIYYLDRFVANTDPQTAQCFPGTTYYDVYGTEIIGMTLTHEAPSVLITDSSSSAYPQNNYNSNNRYYYQYLGSIDSVINNRVLLGKTVQSYSYFGTGRSTSVQIYFQDPINILFIYAKNNYNSKLNVGPFIIFPGCEYNTYSGTEWTEKIVVNTSDCVDENGTYYYYTNGQKIQTLYEDNTHQYYTVRHCSSTTYEGGYRSNPQRLKISSSNARNITIESDPNLAADTVLRTISHPINDINTYGYVSSDTAIPNIIGVEYIVIGI